MPFDEKLAERVRKLLKKEGGGTGFSEKRMFGGLAFMLGDKMCLGVLGNRLVARIGPQKYENALTKPHVDPMDFTGRPLKGYVYVSPLGIERDTQLRSWLRQSIAFVSTQEKKKVAKRRPPVTK